MPELQPSEDPQKLKQKIKSFQIVWAVWLFSQLFFFGIIASMLKKLAPPQQVFTPVQIGLIWKLALGGVVLTAFFGHFIRMQIYKRNWQIHAVTIKGYFQANFLIWATFSGILYFSILMMVLIGKVTPMVWPAGISLLLFLVTFPTGKPLQPRKPVFELPGDKRS